MEGSRPGDLGLAREKIRKMLIWIILTVFIIVRRLLREEVVRRGLNLGKHGGFHEVDGRAIGRRGGITTEKLTEADVVLSEEVRMPPQQMH